MIISGDITTILFKDLAVFGISTFRKGSIPDGEVSTERICIIPKELKDGEYWDKCFVEVNFCVPYVKGLANTKRLNELERLAKKLKGTAVYDNTRYDYETYSTSQEHDSALKCYYVNAKILFKAKNY